MSTSFGWEVNEHITRCTSPMSVVRAVTIVWRLGGYPALMILYFAVFLQIGAFAHV